MSDKQELLPFTTKDEIYQLHEYQGSSTSRGPGHLQFTAAGTVYGEDTEDGESEGGTGSEEELSDGVNRLHR